MCVRVCGMGRWWAGTRTGSERCVCVRACVCVTIGETFQPSEVLMLSSHSQLQLLSFICILIKNTHLAVSSINGNRFCSFAGR